jgi:membrane protein implicated in regulation of membrane protease activity
MFCLAVAAGMLIWGKIVLDPYLTGVLFLVYWAVCFAFTLGAILIALLDIRAVRRRVRNQHRDLIQRTLEGVESKAKPNADKPEAQRARFE